MLFFARLQRFPTTKGYTYTVRFGLAAHPGYVGSDQVLVTVGDFQELLFSARSKGHGRPNWVVIVFVFTATGYTSTIRFEAPDHAPVGALISNIVISEGEWENGGYDSYGFAKWDAGVSLGSLGGVR